MTIVFKTTLPKKLDITPIVDEIIKGGYEAHNGIQKDYESSTRTWDTKVVFDTSLKKSSDLLEFATETNNLIYTFVHEGTKPHIITPKKPGGVLAFNSKFTPKTRVGQILSRAGGSSPPVRFATRVNHPGTKGRKQSELIETKQTPRVMRILTKSINKGIKNYGK